MTAAVVAAGAAATEAFPGSSAPDARGYAASAAVDASSAWPRKAKVVLAASSCAALAIAHTAAEAAITFGQYVAVETAARRAELVAQAALLRDILGNPFCPVRLTPAWLTPTAISLANVASATRHLPSGHLDPDRLAVLADALEEAGCTEQAVLDHLRAPGPHVLGCWAVDLVVAKQ